ncbi:MAG: hypothetical protein KAS62_08855, partial [Candidatus Delongbacteria bacterium]|nr:hypothetical protein [Candidatus Delongbacteria bacterium]
TCLNSKPFSVHTLENLNPNPLVARSDLFFENVEIDLNDSSSLTFSSPDYDININGGYLYRGTIIGTAGNSTINLSNSAYLEDVNLHDFIFTGLNNIRSQVYLLGESVNNGVMQTDAGHYTLNIEGNFTNNDSIRNNLLGWNLTTDFFGENIINNGYWSDHILNLRGTTTKNISCLNSKPFSSIYFDNYNSAPIVAQTDLIFENVVIDLHDSSYIDFTNGYNMIVDGGSLYRGTVKGFQDSSSIYLNNDASLRDINLYDFILYGTIDIRDNVCFYGETTNEAVLQNSSGTHYTLTIEGNITNNDTIRSKGGYNFTIDWHGNISNNGTWTNYYTALMGNTDT